MIPVTADDADLWFPLCRTLLTLAAEEPAETPEDVPATRRRGLLSVLSARRDPPRERRAPPETPTVRCNKIALAAASQDWSAVPPTDRDLLARALASDPTFAALSAAFAAAILAGIPEPAATPEPEDDVPAFVFAPVVCAPAVKVPPARTVPVPDVADHAFDAFSVTPVPPAPAPWAATESPRPSPEAAWDVPEYAAPVVLPEARPNVRAEDVRVAPHVPDARRTSSTCGLELVEVDVRDAPVACLLRVPGRADVAVRWCDGVLLRPLFAPGSWDPVTPEVLPSLLRDLEDLGDPEVADLPSGSLTLVDGVVHRPTEAPLVHVACVRTVRPLGRGQGLLRPRPDDGHVLAWRFPDGLGTFGCGRGRRRGTEAVTWDLAADPGPTSGIVPDGQGRAALGLPVGSAWAAAALFRAARDAFGHLRPDLAWAEPAPPVEVKMADVLPHDLAALVDVARRAAATAGADAILRTVESLDDAGTAPRETSSALSDAAGRTRGGTRADACAVMVARVVAEALAAEADLVEGDALASAMGPR